MKKSKKKKKAKKKPKKERVMLLLQDSGEMRVWALTSDYTPFENVWRSLVKRGVVAHG